MRSHISLLLCGLLAMVASESPRAESAELTGLVTRASSTSDFDVNGVRILCNGKTSEDSKSVRDRKVVIVNCPVDSPYVGEGMVIHFIQRDNLRNAVYATRIESQLLTPFGELSGSAVIDAEPTKEASSARQSDFTIRADGYRVRITASSKVEWNPTLQSLSDVKAGDWIKYKGRLQGAGVLAASWVQFSPNVVARGEEKLRAKNEYDPSVIPADAKQNRLKAIVMGYDAKRFPPFKDAAMQARLEKIGTSLVPAYQRALPGSDPAKIDFRFQLIDTKLVQESLKLPSGIILLPHQVVERMQNDSQIAAFLADGIACALEKQQYHTAAKVMAGYALTYAAALASSFAPYAEPGMMGTFFSQKTETKATEQRDRVSLILLHDAGYDITQAPIAWWLLASEEPGRLSDNEVPERVAYFYRILREVWKTTAAPASTGN